MTRRSFSSLPSSLSRWVLLPSFFLVGFAMLAALCPTSSPSSISVYHYAAKGFQSDYNPTTHRWSWEYQADLTQSCQDFLVPSDPPLADAQNVVTIQMRAYQGGECTPAFRTKELRGSVAGNPQTHFKVMISGDFASDSFTL